MSPNTQYKFRGRIEQSGSPGSAIIRLSQYANGNGTVFFNGAYGTGTFEHVFTTDSSPTNFWVTAIAGNGNVTGIFDDISVKAINPGTPPKNIPPYGVDAGNTFGGPIQQSSQGYMYFPTGRTEERGRGRGVYGGGGFSTPTNPANIAYIDVQSQGNTTRFGDLTTSNRVWIHGFGSSTRAIWSGGGNTGGSNTANTIDFVTIATTSNATDFGDATVAALARASLSNDTRGLSACGFVSPANINTIDFVNVANLGNATDFGDATVARRGVARMGSSTRGIFAGGMTPSASDVMDFVTIASTGNAQDFGNLVVAARHDSQGCSNGTRGIIAGGNTPSGDVNTIQFVTIASAGDASDFGDLQQTMEACGSLDNTIRGVFSGSYTPSINTMNFITIATTGNALDFGDNTHSNYAAGGTSDSHGGLS